MRRRRKLGFPVLQLGQTGVNAGMGKRRASGKRELRQLRELKEVREECRRVCAVRECKRDPRASVKVKGEGKKEQMKLTLNQTGLSPPLRLSALSEGGCGAPKQRLALLRPPS